MKVIGIDPGVHTGIAIWCTEKQEFDRVMSLSALEAMEWVLEARRFDELSHVVWEDARLRTWFGSKGREALQGAGSIKRDCSLWEEFFKRNEIANVPTKPSAGATKWNSATFKRLTGWPGRTNEHARDAGLLVFKARARVESERQLA